MRKLGLHDVHKRYEVQVHRCKWELIKEQNKTENECGGVQNRGKVCLHDSVRRAERECQTGEV